MTSVQSSLRVFLKAYYYINSSLGEMQEMEKVGKAPYVVVYFNADTRLALIPDTDFFSGLHSALLPCHRQNLKVSPLAKLGFAGVLIGKPWLCRCPHREI
jgi:hypothetical protein